MANEQQKPSKGRVVRLFIEDGSGNLTEECAAIITRVWENDSVNVCGFRENGNASPFTSVPRKSAESVNQATTTWEFPTF